VPSFIYGHSLGGLIIADAFQDKNLQSLFSGIILHAPPLDKPIQVVDNPQLLIAARALSYVAPQFGVDKINFDTLLRDPYAKQRYLEDKLVWQGDLKARTAEALIDAASNAVNLAPNIFGNLLFIQGTADQVVPISAIEPWLKNTSSKDKTLYRLIGGFHENLYDYEKKTVYDIIHGWTSKIIAGEKHEGFRIIEIDVTDKAGNKSQ